MEMPFNFIRLSLNLALKIGKEFVIFKSWSVCLLKRRDPRDEMENLVTLKEIFASLK